MFGFVWNCAVTAELDWVCRLQVIRCSETKHTHAHIYMNIHTHFVLLNLTWQFYLHEQTLAFVLSSLLFSPLYFRICACICAVWYKRLHHCHPVDLHSIVSRFHTRTLDSFRKIRSGDFKHFSFCRCSREQEIVLPHCQCYLVLTHWLSMKCHILTGTSEWWCLKRCRAAASVWRQLYWAQHRLYKFRSSSPFPSTGINNSLMSLNETFSWFEDKLMKIVIICLNFMSLLCKAKRKNNVISVLMDAISIHFIQTSWNANDFCHQSSTVRWRPQEKLEGISLYSCD